LEINIDILQPALASQETRKFCTSRDSAALLESTMDTIENVMSELRPPCSTTTGSRGVGLAREELLQAHGDRSRCAPASRTATGTSSRNRALSRRPGALNNVAKHARARHVEIALDHANGEYVMSVQDTESVRRRGRCSDKPKPDSAW